MNMTERYIAAYAFECLTGFHGTNPDYAAVIKHTRFVPNNDPVMKGIIDIVQKSGNDPRDVRVKAEVKAFILEAIKPKEIEQKEDFRDAAEN